jgi:Delta3-Delta2-enoyl-CoA isomerase
MLELIDHPERIRELRLARPPVNALNLELLHRIAEAVNAGSQQAAIVITGQPGIFSAGLDVRGMLELDRDGVAAVFIELWRAQRAIALSPVPVIFGLTGHCPAGGTVLAINGDYRVLAQGDFRLGLNEVQVGLFPGAMISSVFKRLVGGHAAQLLTRGALIDPPTALRVGLVDELCEASQVTKRALEIAGELCALPREPMLRTRALVREDLHALFADSSETAREEGEVAAWAVDMWFVPATQARLRAVFTKRGAG